MDRAKDANVLGWAAEQGRLVLTHDGKTMARHAADRMRRAEPVAGVLIVPTRMPIGEAIDDLLLIAECTETEDWQASVVYLPLDR